MADQNNATQPERAPASKLEYGETQPKRNDVKEQRGGPQDNQLTGQTEKGAHNQELKGRNPQGNKSTN